MKKILSLILCILIIASIAPCALAEDNVKIVIDSVPLSAKDVNGNAVYPIIKDGTTYLPVRAVGEAFGKAASWDGETNTVFLGAKGEMAQLYTEKVKIVLDGVVLEPKDANGNAVYPFIENGTTYLPVRAVGEAFGKNVSWDGETRTVSLTTPAADKIDGNVYRIYQSGTNKSIAVENASKENSAAIVAADYADNDSQLWSFTALGDGYYSIVNKGSKKSIDVPAASKDTGKGVTQYDGNGGANQTLKLIENADGTYTMQFKHSNLYFTAEERYVTQENASASAAQSFRLEFVKEGIMKGVLSSEGFKALGDMGERFRAYLYSDISFSRNVKAQAERKLEAADYFSLDAQAQKALLLECMQLTAYNQVWINSIPNESGATYEITSIDYNPSYDVWRGTMKPVWIHHIKMQGDAPGQIHEFEMISTDEHSSMIKDSLNAMARLPYAVRKYITRMIYRDDSANSFNANYNTVYMRIQGTRDEETIAVLLAHELGHTLDQNTTSISDKWDAAMAADGCAISGYGRTNRTEDLAEYSRLYHSVKKDAKLLETVESIYPNRARIFRAMLYSSDNTYYAKYKDDFYSVIGLETKGVSPMNLCADGKKVAVTENGIELSENATKWLMYPTTDGYWVLFAEDTGKCINVPGESTDEGKEIILWSGGSGNNEKMTKQDNADQSFKLKFKHSSLYLGIKDGKLVQTANGANFTLEN